MFKLTKDISNGFIDELEKISTRKRKKLEKKLIFGAQREGNKKPGSSMATQAGDQHAIGEFDDRGGTDKIMKDSENGTAQDWMNR